MKKIIWRLKEQPSSASLQGLVLNGILTKDEAREILFSETSEEEIKEVRDMESLKSEIKFLRELVEKLSNRSQIIEHIREIEKPYWRWGWYEPYKFYCQNDSITYTAGNALNLTATNTDNQMNCSFSSIKTF